jgi:Replication-relaxation
MNSRDFQIVKALDQFRVLDRNQLISLFFNNQKQPIVTCNRIMKRLALSGYVKASKDSKPYNYFPADSSMRPNSGKLLHYKAITDHVISLQEHGILREYEIEPTLGKKGTVEPDLFAIWRNAPFFMEVQRAHHSEQTMQKKFDRYEKYFMSRAWEQLPFQQERKVFPYVWLVCDRTYNLKTSFTVFQSKDVPEFIKKYMKKGSR